MGCASSTPMIQTTGSEMLKAASHVATDATKTAEDAVEGIKDSVGKTLETAKDSVASTVESVKHEVESVVKEKSEKLEDATNSLMEKLHLKQTENESSNEDSEENSKNIIKTETEDLKTQLNENSTTVNDALGDSKLEANESLRMAKEHVVTGTDTETDSLKTSTPEPEIEQAFAKSQNNQEDEQDNPPTPKPTLAELENLTAELLKQQQQQETQQLDITTVVNDITTMSNDPVISVKHENIKTLDSSNNTMSLTADNNTIKDNESATTTPTATSLQANNDFKTANVHNTPKNRTVEHTDHKPPIKLALTNTTAATAVNSDAVVDLIKAVKDKEKPQKTKNRLKEEKVSKNSEEKRPKTTEWEKLADMLAQMRKFNPHDAFRRGGTYTKFGGGQFRERHHLRGGMDDDVSDTASYFRGSPHNSQRSSARAQGRVQRLPNRPTTGNNRRYYELPTHNGGGGHYAQKVRRSSNVSTTTGRKFDYNPTRSRVNEFVSSTPFIQSSFLQNTLPTQMPYAPYSTSYEGVKSPPDMRSHHSRSDMIALPPLETQERTISHSQPSHNHQHTEYSPSTAIDHNGNSMTLPNAFDSNEIPVLTRQSSNISLSSNSSEDDNLKSFKSSNLDIRLQTLKLPSVKNTSSFLTTPRSTQFSLTKSYTDLYFSTTGNKENKPKAASDKSPFQGRKSTSVCSKKHAIK